MQSLGLWHTNINTAVHSTSFVFLRSLKKSSIKMSTMPTAPASATHATKPTAPTPPVAMEPAAAIPVDQLIIMDHNKVRTLFNEYPNAKTAEVKQQLAYHIIRELSMHSCKEEEVVYPALARAYGEGLQDHLLGQHQMLKESLDKLSGMTCMGNEHAFDAQVMIVRQIFETHIKEEEQEDIPKLLKAPGVDAHDLGHQFQQAAAHACTRPHPMAPNKPPMNIAAHIATAPLDAAADAIRFVGNAPDVPTVKPTTTHSTTAM